MPTFIERHRHQSFESWKGDRSEGGNHFSVALPSSATYQPHHRYFHRTKKPTAHYEKTHRPKSGSHRSASLPTLSPVLIPLVSKSIAPSPISHLEIHPPVSKGPRIDHSTFTMEIPEKSNRGNHLLGPLIGGLGGLAILMALAILLLRKKQSQKRGWNVTSTSLNRHNSWSTASTQIPPPVYSPETKRWTTDTLVDSTFTQYAPQLSYKALHPSHYSLQDAKQDSFQTLISQDADEKNFERVPHRTLESYQPQIGSLAMTTDFK